MNNHARTIQRVRELLQVRAAFDEQLEHATVLLEDESAGPQLRALLQLIREDLDA